MTTLHPEQQAQVTPEVTVARAGPGRRFTVILSVVALVVGAAAGLFIGRATAPDKTVTKSVAAPAYATSGAVTGTVFFNGTRASFAGPAEVKSGTRMTWILDSVDPSNTMLAVGPVTAGTTWEDATAYSAKYPGNYGEPSWLGEYKSLERMNGSFEMTMTEGVYAVYVLTSPETTNTSFPVTMIRVTK